MTPSLKAALIRIALSAILFAAYLPLGTQGADPAETRGNFVTNAIHGAPRTAVTKDCVRTAIPNAGLGVAECLPAPTSRAPAAPQPAPTTVAKPTAPPEPKVPDFVGEPEPRDMKPVPPMEPLAQEDDRLSDPMWYYEEEPTPKVDTILSHTVNPDYEFEVAAAEADMARSRQAPAAAQPAPAAAPVAQVPPTKKVIRVTLEAGPRFDFNKAALRPTGKEKMDKFLSDLQEIDYETISVVGHTDRIGPAAVNQKLSKQRADSIKQYLANNNIPAGKITARGVGSTQPVTKPDECKGLKGKKLIDCLQPDRRVEVEASGGQIVRQ
jgi:outer membrane protein OmpA-like peptidoglycan-associated protein